MAPHQLFRVAEVLEYRSNLSEVLLSKCLPSQTQMSHVLIKRQKRQWGRSLGSERRRIRERKVKLNGTNKSIVIIK